jgi:predicted dehydrogenase
MDKWRYHPGILALAAIARSGEFGPVVGLRTTRIDYSHPYSDTDCVWTLLPHDLSIALEIFGKLPAPRSAVADVANGRLLGMIVFSSIDAGPWHTAEIGSRSAVLQRMVVLLCRDASVILQDSYADHIAVLENPPPDGTKVKPQIAKRPIPQDMPLLAELDAFIRYLGGGPPPRSSVQEAAQAVKAIAEARRLAGV